MVLSKRKTEDAVTSGSEAGETIMFLKKNIILSVVFTAVTVIIGISGALSAERRYKISR